MWGTNIPGSQVAFQRPLPFEGMSRQDPGSRGRAGRLAGVVAGGLLLSALLAPDALRVWAETRPEGRTRSVVRAWSSPVAALSESLRLDAPLRGLEQLLDSLGGGEDIDAIAPPAVTESPNAGDRTSTTMAPRTADWEAPLRILGVGDSLMLDLQYGLERVLEPRPDVVVEGRGALGFGFTVPFWDWEDDVVPDYERLVAEVRPDVVVVMIGANEFEGYAVDGEELVPGTSPWREVLAFRADDAVSRWRADGAHVYWWTTPRMRAARYLTEDLNAVWSATAEEWGSGVTVIDSMKVLGGADGAYRETVVDPGGHEVPLRKEHGVHFHEVGADLLAEQLEARLVADGWLAGS